MNAPLFDASAIRPRMPARAFPILIIGTGGIVKDAHLPAYRLAGFPVWGIYNRTRSRAEALASWRASGLPLRRWLVNGLLLHARERQRELRRAARDGSDSPCGGCGCATPCEPGLEPSAFEEFERAWSRALLSDACTVAEQELVAEGDADAWACFRRHNLDGLEYAEIAQQLRIAAAEARTRARRAAYRFERALRRLLADEGVTESDLDDEIAWLLEVSGRS
jgi:DNA-directed RNA polymerase specialized sigma24 family protein